MIGCVTEGIALSIGHRRLDAAIQVAQQVGPVGGLGQQGFSQGIRSALASPRTWGRPYSSFGFLK